MQTLRTKTSDVKQGKRLFHKQVTASDFYTKLNLCTLVSEFKNYINFTLIKLLTLSR